jgi:hypothetical protein
MSQRAKKRFAGVLSGAIASAFVIIVLFLQSFFLPSCGINNTSKCEFNGYSYSPTAYAEFEAWISSLCCGGFLVLGSSWLSLVLAGVRNESGAWNGKIIMGCSCLIPILVSLAMLILGIALEKLDIDLVRSNNDPFLVIFLMAGIGGFFGWFAADWEMHMDASKRQQIASKKVRENSTSQSKGSDE